MKSIIALDMDGTFADLYSVPNWLEKLRADDPSPYLDAKPLCNMHELNKVCALLRKAGYEITVITCLSKGAGPEYKQAIREAKKAWLKKYSFLYDHFHGIDYKTPKKECLRRSLAGGGTAWLVDDEARHRDSWPWGPAIDPTAVDIIDALRALIPEDVA